MGDFTQEKAPEEHGDADISRLADKYAHKFIEFSNCSHLEPFET